jgi:GNAT superfamily N-acetyltransferase
MFGPIHPLTSDDLPGCLALARDREWLPEERKWRLLFDIGTVYGVRDQAGDLAGVTVLTCHGAELAAIGMLLVAARYGRRGLGRGLMTHALAAAGKATVLLHATPSGRPLYDKLGFVPVGASHTHLGGFVPAGRGGGPAGGPAGSRPAGPGDLSAIRRLDAQANGTDRARLVRRLPGFTEQLRVVERRGVVTGYGGAYRGLRYVSIGPVIAENTGDAQTLIADLARAVDGPVRVDIDDRHPQLLDWAAARGLAWHDSSLAMVLGGRPLPGDRGRCFAPLMRALG